MRKSIASAVMSCLSVAATATAVAKSLDGYLVAEGSSRNYALPYATLEICPASGDGCRRVKTGSDGRFYVSRLRPGDYDIRVFQAGQDYFTRVSVKRGEETYVRIVVEK